jgi:hypothetical protein
MGVIDFAMVWRAAIWNRRKLDMPDEGPQIMQAVREITFQVGHDSSRTSGAGWWRRRC